LYNKFINYLEYNLVTCVQYNHTEWFLFIFHNTEHKLIKLTGNGVLDWNSHMKHCYCKTT